MRSMLGLMDAKAMMQMVAMLRMLRGGTQVGTGQRVSTYRAHGVSGAAIRETNARNGVGSRMKRARFRGCSLTRMEIKGQVV
jgi:hypothetical protein